MVNSKWFNDRMADRGISGRRMAAILGVDPSAFSRFLSGFRALKPQEAADLAAALDVPLQAVLQAAGIDTREPTPTVPVTAIVRLSSIVHDVDGNNGEGQAPLPPLTGAAPVQAMRMHTPGHPMDGWLLYTEPTGAFEPDAVNRLAVVTTPSGTRLLGVLRQDPKQRGAWLIQPLTGNQVAVPCAVATATPVRWLAP